MSPDRPQSLSEASISRRRFLVSSAAVATATSWHPDPLPAYRYQGQQQFGDLRVTKIETHDIGLEYHDWLHHVLNHYYGPLRRTIYVVHTNKGLIGLGESGSLEPEETRNKYIGTNPFDWVGDENSLGLGTAMYDLMGQAAGVPVYKLFGQKYRSWVPVGSWTVSSTPAHMAEAVQRYAARGYTWMKYHLSPFENVFDQFKAMEAVAPRGFKILLDITMGGTNDHMFGMLERISRSPIAGAFEDPLYEKDIQGYIELRKKLRLPLLLHHSPLGATFEVLQGAADGYILGHARIGVAMRRAGLFAAANMPFMLQNVGGSITRTMTVHMQSAFKTASQHFHSDAETWQHDVVDERPEPINGFLRVSEKPGLGLTLNREKLEQLKAVRLPDKDRWIIKTIYDNGTTMYNLANPKESIFMVRPDRRRLIPMSYDAPITTHYWDNDGSEQYKQMFQRLEKEGMVMERPPEPRD